MSYKLNHSRNLNYYGPGMDRLVEKECRKPTQKQIRFYSRLRHMCDENGIDKTLLSEPRTRASFTIAINTLIERLKDNGVEIHSQQKDVEVIYTMPDSKTLGAPSKERIIVKEEKEDGCNC